MSIATLSPNHYNRVFTTLALKKDYGKHKNRSLSPLLGIAGENHLKNKVADMVRLNFRCYVNRYGGELKGLPKVRLIKGQLLSDMELLKAVMAMTYQIEMEFSEGADKEEAAAYEFFQELEKSLLYIIVCELPEWETAEWFID